MSIAHAISNLSDDMHDNPWHPAPEFKGFVCCVETRRSFVSQAQFTDK